MIMDRIQVHGFEDVADHALMLDQFPQVLRQTFSLGSSFQKALSPCLHEAPFPVKVLLPAQCFVCCDLLSVSSVKRGRRTTLRLFDPGDLAACFSRCIKAR